MNVIGHDHVTTEGGPKFRNATSSICFKSCLCFPQIRDRPPISSAKRDKVDWIARKDYLQTLGTAFDHLCLISPLLRAGETPAATTSELSWIAAVDGCHHIFLS